MISDIAVFACVGVIYCFHRIDFPNKTDTELVSRICV